MQHSYGDHSFPIIILTGITYEIVLETLYFVYVVAAIPYWSSVEKPLIKVTEIINNLNTNNNEIFDEFIFHSFNK